MPRLVSLTSMNKINYDGRRFRSVENSSTGEVGAGTAFEYHQAGDMVWAEYAGGGILRGHLIAVCDDDGGLDMRYQHINAGGVLMTGICSTVAETLADGRLRLHERWQWTCGDHSKGESVLEEL